MIETKRTLKDQVRDYILDYIEKHHLQEGDRLPTQRELSKLLNVSTKIPELVLSELEYDRIVERRCGRGTFLIACPKHEYTVEEVPQQSRNVFVILPTLRNQHFAEYAARAEVALKNANYTMQIITGEAFETPQEMIGKMVREGTNGIIGILSFRELREFAFRHKIPLVELRYHSVGHRKATKGLHIITDLRQSARLLGDHLLKLGHRDVYLAGDLPVTDGPSDCRFTELTHLLERNHCKVRFLPQKYLIKDYQSYEAIGAELAQVMLSEGLPATAAVFFNSQRAVGAMRYLERAGVRIPEDFSIAGFDNPFQNGFPEPALTCAYHENVIETAVSLLFSKDMESNTIAIDPHFSLGNTTAIPNPKRPPLCGKPRS